MVGYLDPVLHSMYECIVSCSTMSSKASNACCGRGGEEKVVVTMTFHEQQNVGNIQTLRLPLDRGSAGCADGYNVSTVLFLQ